MQGLQITIDESKQQISLNKKPNANIATRWHCCHTTVCEDAIYSDWKSQSCCLQGQLSSPLDRRHCFQFLYVGHLHIRVRPRRSRVLPHAQRNRITTHAYTSEVSRLALRKHCSTLHCRWIYTHIQTHNLLFFCCFWMILSGGTTRGIFNFSKVTLKLVYGPLVALIQN